VSELERSAAGRSSATPATVDEPLRRLVAAWLLGYSSKNTRRSYAGDVRAWFTFCADHGVEPLEARRAHIDAWARFMENAGAPPRTVARRLAAVSSFYGYCVDEESIATSPAARVRRPKVDRNDSPTVGLDQGQARALLEATRRHGSRRDIALVTLLIHNGLRISEALDADVEHLGAQRGHRTLRIRRKGGTERAAALPPAVTHALDDYLDAREHGPLFVTKTGRRYDQPAAFRMLRRMARHAGLDVADKLSLHSMRHTAITAGFDAGKSLRDMQDFAGHADPRQTRLYDRARHNLDRHAAYAVAAWFAGEEPSASGNSKDK
jgi:integrase/recombinase XerD